MFDYQQAECGTVGALLLDGRCLEKIRPILPGAEAFESPNCRKAYETICALAQRGIPIDPVTVGQRTGLDNRFLAQCMDLSPTLENAQYHARAVAEGAARRRLRALGQRLEAGSLDPTLPPEALREEAQGCLEGLDTGEDGQVPTIQQDLEEFIAHRCLVNDGKIEVLRSGFPSLDKLLGGFARGGFYILAARPGVGKSALGIALGDMLSKQEQVLYASLEMSRVEINARRVAAFSGTGRSYGQLIFGKTSQEEDIDVLNTCSILRNHPLRLWDPGSLTVAELEMEAQREKAGVVIVDYLGLLKAADPRQTEYERVTQVSGDLKRMARRLKCVVIALCQLNRESTMQGSEGLPKLINLRSSGALEQDADGVMLLHRDEADPQNPNTPLAFYINVAKNRHGRTGTAQLSWYAPVNRFEDRSGKWPVMSWR